MAYDVEIATPRGRIGLNVNYNDSTLKDTVILGYLQNADGTWTMKGYFSIGGSTNISGTPGVILANILEDEGVLPGPVTEAQAVKWLSTQSKEAAQLVIVRWFIRVAREMYLIFLNRIIGIMPGTTAPPPALPGVDPFLTPEHAIRVSIKAIPYQVNPTTGEITI